MGRNRVKKVYDYYIEGKLVATGTIDEIEKITNRTAKSIRSMANYYEKVTGTNKQRLVVVGKRTERTPDIEAYDKTLQIIAYNSKKLRKSRRLTQKQLAEKVGLHQFQISQIETGRAATLYMIAKLIAFYEIETIEMFEDWLDTESEDDEFEI